ncbi:MAG: AAA family ATPase [Candidatus Xenobia bacterium]
MTMTSSPVIDVTTRVRAELARVVVGQSAALDQILATVLAGGHVLLEGVPGLAKTLMARALARAFGGNFRRVQFTPDLMPSDVTGTEMYQASSASFEVKRGPVFTDFLLADEINRTPPKTQSALLECMQERTVTLGGKSYPLSPAFTVLATQNPVEYEGTYPLPEAQMDRFTIKVLVVYPEAPEELEVLRRYERGEDPLDFERAGVQTVADLSVLQECRKSLQSVRIDEGVLTYILEVVRLSRQVPHLLLGASPRAGIALLQVSRALSAMRGKDYVSPDEVKEMAGPVLRHRIMPTPEAQVEGISADRVVADILAGVKVPR